ncbi:MAG: fibronectin type III domain-containing protein, partial [Nitrospirae bacterium]|nr:fibronectin type III domain-containing protein [Nitrospirota bacterium]
DFGTTNNTCSGGIAPTASCTVDVTMSPLTSGAKSATSLRISSDDPELPILDAALSGSSVSAAPSGLTATAVSSSQITVSWTDNSDETAFSLERKAGACDGSGWAVINAPAAGATSYANGSLPTGTQYSYRIRAYKSGAGYSAYSNCATAATLPQTPTGLAATAVSSTQITVSWNDTSGETSYSLERKAGTCGGAGWAQITAPAANATSYANGSLSTGSQYSYRIRAYKTGIGYSAYSNCANAATSISAPTGLTATAVSASQITVSWNDTSEETAYSLERKAGECGDSGWAVINAPAVNATSYANGSLASETEYSYRIRAYKTGTGYSAYSNCATATTLVIPPEAPSGLTAVTVSSTQINVSWTDNSDETAFSLERKAGACDGAGWTVINAPAANTESYANGSLSVGTQYSYRIRAYNTGTGYSAYSNCATATTLLATPTGLTATAVSATQINLGWTDNSDETSFSIERKAGECDGSGWAVITVRAANTTSYANGSLTPETDYSYRIRAYKTGTGYSAYSNCATAITP